MQSLFTGWPNFVLGKLVRTIKRAVEDPNAGSFYIGRTANLEERKERHGADELLPLYSTDSFDHAIQVEASLIQKFYHYQNCINESVHGGGGLPKDGKLYVYLAIWRL